MSSSSISSTESTPPSRPSSTGGSPMPSVSRAAVSAVGERADDAVERLAAVAAASGVEIVGEGERADIAIVLGGDGSMLRALRHYLGTGVPVIGVNYGRVGFLTSMSGDRLEEGIARAFAGDYRTVALSTLEVRAGGRTEVAVNDVVVTGGTLGRMVELGYAIGDEELGSQPCDGLICATPTGSTAYNLSNNGPVLVWGLDALVLTFVAPHALHVRPLVVPHGPDVIVTNLTPDLPAGVLVDGQEIARLDPGDRASVRIGEQQSLLATLPESTFFTRYAATFGRR
jgi:NAD+ kinase